MRRKQLAKRVAIAVLSAATVMTAAPVGTFAATNVVSVDASDAATVDSPKVDPNNDTDTTGIINELSGATVTAGTDDKAAVAGAKENWSVAPTATYSYVVTSVSDITFKATDNGSDLESAKVTLTLSVANKTTNAPKGTAQITVDLLTQTTNTKLKLTAAQKVAAVKTVLEAKAKVEGTGAITYENGDNVASLATKLGIGGLKITAETGAKLSGDLLAVNTDDSANGANAGASAVTVDISVGTITDATSTTEGSVPYTITYKAAQYDAKGNKTDVTDSSSITGKIAKTKGQNDAAYAQKIQNAISAATWTSDDIAKGDDGKATGLTAEGKAKLVNIIKAVDDNTNAKVNYADGAPDNFTFKGFGKTPDDAKATGETKTPDATVSRFTDGKHGKDGFAHIQFFASRMDGKAANVVDSFDVDITIKEGESNVKKELASAFKSGVLAASKSLKATSVASQADAVKVITDAIDKELANSYNGKTYASDIKSYEVVVPKDDYGQAGTKDDEKGWIKFYIKVDTGRTSASDPTTTDIWYFRTNIATANPENDFAANVNADSTKTFTQVENKEAAEAAGNEHSTLAYIKDLKEVSKVDAASVSLPSEVSYNVNMYGDTTSGTGLKVKDILTITPKTANHWTIRVTNSNNTAYVVKDSAGTPYSAPVLNTETDVEKLPTIILNDKTKPASTTLKVDLLDDDGNVISTTSTTITVKKGFDDVQNPSYFAYDSVNALASTVKLEKDSDADTDGKSYKTNGRDYTNLTIDDDTKLTASPVIAGIGNNKFDPYADVTRGQFITFLWRNAVNEYSFADATTKAYTKDPASYTGKTDFADVDAKAYYAKAVEWAAKNGIAFGSDATHFNPNKTITRAEAVSFIYRLKAQGAVYNNYQQFDDVSSSAYYANAVGYARSAGITAGKSGTKFAPNDTVTRGEAAAFIYRMAAGEDGFYYDAVEVTSEP